MNNIGKRLMPIYLIKFLEENYFDIIPENFGRRMVSRQFIAEIKALYDEFDGKPIDNYGRRMVPEYLIKAFSDIEYIEYTDDDVKYEKTVPTGALKYATLDMLGGMTYKVLNDETNEYELRDSAVTSVVAKKTYEIDEHILAVTGYGQGLTETLYNYIDFENKKFIQKVARVQFKDVELLYSSSLTTFYFYQNDKKIGRTNVMIAGFTTVDKNYDALDDLEVAGTSGSNSINLRDISCTSIDEFRAKYDDYYVYYQLDTPVETDISDYIKDNFIEVEPTGSVTFTNEYEQAVPSEVTYLIKD